MYKKLCFVGVLTYWRFADTQSSGSFQNHQLIETLVLLAFSFPLFYDISFLQTFTKVTKNRAMSCTYLFFFNLCCGTLSTEATTGLLYQPRMIGDSDCGEIGGMKIGRGARSTRRKPAPRHFVHHKSYMARPGFEPGPPRWEASD
jgi:hypothetical protein